MLKPTIHMNGTSREELLDQLCKAGAALRDAMGALAEASPNGRDYYVQGDGAIRQALAEHAARREKLAEVLKEIEELAEHVADAP
ncbi:MAG TPA: hypothetical protein VFV82_04960 [Candidatus Binatia bacterium]|nr:hypothetical protein [Candidatus Binatia bacterium]